VKTFTFIAALGVTLAGCRSEDVLERPHPSFERMLEQPRYDPYEASGVFADGRAMREPPEGAQPHRSTPLPNELVSGRAPNGQYVDEIPLALTMPLLAKGKAAFERTCAACHGVLGDGNTVVARHMKRKPPSLHERRITEKPVGELFTVATEGYGYMPSYRAQLDHFERWAVVAYVKALERSQHAPVAELPPDLQRELRQRLR
jgi:mono/diheme cytochrome c family protein